MKGPSIIFACLISRTHFIAPPPPQSQSQSQLRVALPSSRTQICRGTVTSHPAFRFSRHALITGVPGERDEWQEKGRKKKERERLSTPTLQSSLQCVRVHVYVTWSHTRDRCDRGGMGVRGAFRRMPAPIAGSNMRNCDRVTRACAHNAPRRCIVHTATETREVSGRVRGRL